MNGIHTVDADDGSYSSGNLVGATFFEHTFTDPGTYAYYCAYHGSSGGIGMAGQVIVAEAPAPVVPEFGLPSLALGLAGLIAVAAVRRRLRPGIA